MLAALVVRALRPDRTLNALEALVASVFGEGGDGGPGWCGVPLPWRGAGPGNSPLADVASLVDDELGPLPPLQPAATGAATGACSGVVPVLLCSARGSGQDGSAAVEALAAMRAGSSKGTSNHAVVSLHAVSMGAPEGKATALRLVTRHALIRSDNGFGGGSGGGGGGGGGAVWVLLRNVHLAGRQWLEELEAVIHNLGGKQSGTVAPSFRLFLTADAGTRRKKKKKKRERTNPRFKAVAGFVPQPSGCSCVLPP